MYTYIYMYVYMYFHIYWPIQFNSAAAAAPAAHFYVCVCMWGVLTVVSLCCLTFLWCAFLYVCVRE